MPRSDRPDPELMHSMKPPVRQHMGLYVVGAAILGVLIILGTMYLY